MAKKLRTTTKRAKPRRWPKTGYSIGKGLSDQTIGPGAMYILGLIIKATASGKGTGVRRLSQQTGFSPNGVRSHLIRLKEKGLIKAEIIPTRGKTAFGTNSVTAAVRFLLPEDLCSTV